jgi:hypothetical protein
MPFAQLSTMKRVENDGKKRRKVELASRVLRLLGWIARCTGSTPHGPWYASNSSLTRSIELEKSREWTPFSPAAGFRRKLKVTSSKYCPTLHSSIRWNAVTGALPHARWEPPSTSPFEEKSRKSSRRDTLLPFRMEVEGGVKVIRAVWHRRQAVWSRCKVC